MTAFSTPKSELTSARMFDMKSDADLAYWLDNDAKALDGRPGMNNHVAATRAAAERLIRDAGVPDVVFILEGELARDGGAHRDLLPLPLAFHSREAAQAYVDAQGPLDGSYSIGRVAVQADRTAS